LSTIQNVDITSVLRYQVNSYVNVQTSYCASWITTVANWYQLYVQLFTLSVYLSVALFVFFHFWWII